MKITIDPMPAIRAQAELKINTYFVEHHKNMAYLRSVWARKRDIATNIISGKGVVPQTFRDEADLRGLSIKDFAGLILTKSDVVADVDALELRRQEIMLEVAKATTPEQVKTIEERDPQEILHG